MKRENIAYGNESVEIELYDNIHGMVVEPLELPGRVIPEDFDI